MERRSRISRQTRATLISCLTLLAFAFLGILPGTAGAGQGKIENLEYGSGTDAHPYVLYTPSSYSPKKPLPLVIAAHGCMTTADQFMRATRFNDVAEREGFVVAYLDVDAETAALPQPLQRCWKFYDPSSWRRGQGDAATVAGMTKAVMNRLKIDPERVYMAGTSAGGFLTSAMAAAYPELFAAVGIVAGGAYGDGSCLGPLPGLPVEVISQSARDEMGSNARVVPRMVMGGDADQGISPACADKALLQGLRTNNLVLGNSQTAPLSLEPASSRNEPNPGGYDSTVDTYLDPDGCVIGERWTIHGMNHFWPGGPADEELANFTDPKGPNGAEAVWAFLQRYTKSETSMPCAEAPVKQADPICAKRRVNLVLPRRMRSVKVTVNGKKAPAKIVRGKLRVWLPSGERKRTVIQIKGRNRADKKVKRRFSFSGCGPRRAG